MRFGSEAGNKTPSSSFHLWNMLHDAAVLEIVSGLPPRRYAEVVGRLEALDRVFPVSDGLFWFNRLYRAMTEAVVASASRFRDPVFVEALDCQFSELYFQALRQLLGGPGPGPGAWRPLFAARQRLDLAPLQFALAGVNAHINRDLCVALASCFALLGGGPETEGRHADFLVVNAVLEDVQAEVKQWLITGALAHLDRLFGSCDDLWASWSLTRARDTSWINGQLRHHLRNSSFLSGQHLHSLDRLVGLAGRGLLRTLPV